MIRIEPVNSSQQKREILSQLDPDRDCLLVSDLRAKFEWQNYYLQTRSLLPEEFIFRPVDLWRKLAIHGLPQLQILSNEYVTALLASRLATRSEPFLRGPAAATSLFAYMSQLGFVFEHPEGRDLMKEWFLQNIDSFYRWGHWYQVAEELWWELREKKSIAEAWIPCLLGEQVDKLSDIWPRSLVLDLGLEIKHIEAELFAQWSKWKDIRVLFPQVEFQRDYPLEFLAYQALVGDSYLARPQATQQDDFPLLTTPTSVGWAQSFASSLSEIKYVVGQIREWLEQGILPTQIAIVAADIGLYWPVLRNYLQKEGIPCARPYNTSLQSLPAIAQFLARLKLSMKQWQQEDLELHLYAGESADIDYSHFRRLYSNVYSDEDLGRQASLAEQIEKRRSFSRYQEISRDEFVLWALQHWTANRMPAALEQIWKQFLLETASEQRLRLQDWLALLAGRLARAEICIQPGDAQGVACVDIISMEYLSADKVFVVGLSEEALKKQNPLRAIQARDLLSLRAATGFPFAPEENRSIEFYLRWNFLSPRDYFLSYAETDFRGELQTPNLIWLQANKDRAASEKNEVESPLSRLDRLQLQTLDDLADHLPDLGLSSRALQRDLGQDIPSPYPLQRFSAGGFQDYQICGFKFVARYFLGLYQAPAIDLDLDRMTNGSLLHRIFELALKTGISPQDLPAQKKCVEACLREVEKKMDAQTIYFPDRYQTYYQGILKKFLDFESQWKKDFPHTEYAEQEARLTAYWDREKGQFCRDPQRGTKFTGVIDRVDRAGKQLCVLDYKSSGANYRNFSSWFSEPNLQLLFYTKVLNDLRKEEGEEVYAALYYSVKPWQRLTGFVRQDTDPEFLPLRTRRGIYIDPQELRQAENDLASLIEQLHQDCEEGNLYARPLDPIKNCSNCDWKKICRAQHLNY